MLISAFVVCFQDNVVANAHAKMVEFLDLQCRTYVTYVNNRNLRFRYLKIKMSYIVIISRQYPSNSAFEMIFV